MDIIGWLDECARDFREARAALQHAEGITEIACTFVGPADNVHGASVLLEERGVAEAPLCIDAGCFGRHARGKIVRGAHLEVRTKLFVKFTIQSLSSQQPLQARDERHGTPLLSSESENLGNSQGEALPILFFLGKLLTTGRSEAIVASAAAVFRRAALRADPSVLLHAVKRGIKRAFLYTQELL